MSEIRCRPTPLPVQQHEVLRAALSHRRALTGHGRLTGGGHIAFCPHCGHERPAYNSRRNRHCPSCQAGAQEKWIGGRRARILDTPCFHVVFTLPEELRPIAQRNPSDFDNIYVVAKRLLSSRVGVLSSARLHEVERALGYALDWPGLKAP